MSEKLKEGQLHVTEAERYLKTSWKRWSPDYESAAAEYDIAANCYRITQQPTKAKECLLLAAKCHKQVRLFFYAAKNIEQAILVAKDELPADEIYKMALESCNLYQQHGSGDAGATVLSKAAGIISRIKPELALQLYQQAADVSAAQSACHQATEYMALATKLLVRTGKYDEAVDSLRREIGYHIELHSYAPVGRLTVGMVIVQLARGDPVAAEKGFKEWGNFCEEAEAYVLEQLIQAYDDEDPETAKQALNSPFIKHMDVDFARLALQIPLPQGISVPQKSTVRENVASPYVSQSAGTSVTEKAEVSAAQQEEEEGDGLC